MTVYHANPEDLLRIAGELDDEESQLATQESATAAILNAHGYTTEAWQVALALQTAQAWSAAWAGSLRARIGLLAEQGSIPVGPAANGITALSAAVSTNASSAPGWQLFAGTPANITPVPAAMATPFGTVASGFVGATAGRELAEDLLDALAAGDVELLFRLLQSMVVHLTDLPFLEDLFTTLDADVTGLLPTLLLDLDVAASDLHLYFEPVAAALAMLDVNDRLPFSADQLMAGHEGFGATPLAYLDFADFSLHFLAAIAGPAVSAFGEDDLPLRSPEYRLPDGMEASNDPRLALIRALLRLDTEQQQAALLAMAGDGLMGDLVAPATLWGDGGSAVATLLQALWTEDAVVMSVVADVMGSVSTNSQPAIVLAMAAALAPHLLALPNQTRWGADQFETPQGPLRVELDTWPESGTGVVSNALFVAMGDADARRLLNEATGALIATFFSSAVDLADPSSVAGVADDLGAVVELVVGAQLSADVAAARRADAEAEMLMAMLGGGIGIVTGGLASGANLGGFATWAVGTLATSNPAMSFAGSAAGISTTATEEALGSGYTSLRGVADFAVFALAAELATRGMLDLPESLVSDGELVVPRSDADWEALLAAINAADFDPEPWFNHAIAIAGYGVPEAP